MSSQDDNQNGTPRPVLGYPIQGSQIIAEASETVIDRESLYQYELGI
jgi:hypothetical protein